MTNRIARLHRECRRAIAQTPFRDLVDFVPDGDLMRYTFPVVPRPCRRAIRRYARYLSKTRRKF